MFEDIRGLDTICLTGMLHVFEKASEKESCSDFGHQRKESKEREGR
jgi:hypothetical protein